MGNAARKARKRSGEPLIKTLKLGTPLEERSIKTVFERDGSIHPSHRAYVRTKRQIEARDGVKIDD